MVVISMAFRHDVVEQHAALFGFGKGLFHLFEIRRDDRHRLIGQDIEAGLDGAQNVIAFSRVVAGNNHQVALFLLEHALKEIRSGVNLLPANAWVFPLASCNRRCA